MEKAASVTVAVERCLRCSASMEWRHGTWQCPRCRLKLGCCEGEPQRCDEPR
jgi:transposase